MRTPGTTHGHHTASAMLSVAAFELASDKTKVSEQLSIHNVWQPKRMLFQIPLHGFIETKQHLKKTSAVLQRLISGVYLSH